MYVEHSLFSPPPPEAVLWRYLDFTKFVSLLDRHALFFARADKLGDPFEGSYPRANVDTRFGMSEERFSEKAVQEASDFLRQSRRFTLVNCWHWSDYESAAMWRMYSREHDGIAVKTDFRSLSESLVGNEVIYIGRVSYIDYEEDFIRESNIFAPYLNKRKSFEHEKEVRAVTQEFPPGDGELTCLGTSAMLVPTAMSISPNWSRGWLLHLTPRTGFWSLSSLSPKSTILMCLYSSLI